MIKLTFLLIIFIVYVLFVAISAFFKILAGGASAIAKGLSQDNEYYPNSIQPQLTADKIIMQLTNFFNETLIQVDDFAHNEYKMQNKKTNLNDKTYIQIKIITIELYLYILNMIIVEFKNYGKEISLACLSVGIEVLYNYVQEQKVYICDISQKELLDMYMLRLDMYSNIRQQNLSFNSDVSSSVLTILEEHNLLFSFIEQDINHSEKYKDYLKLCNSKFEISDVKLKYNHNIDKITNLTNKIYNRLRML